jgi:hypothetical protein
MKHVFRTTGKYWTEEGFGFVLCLVGLVVFYWVGITWLAVLMGLSALLNIKGIRRLLRLRLEIDEQSLTLFSEATPLIVRWSEVVYAQLLEGFRKPKKRLQLCCNGTDGEQVWEITLDYFDHKGVWKLAQHYLPHNVLTEDARRCRPGYQSWKAEVVETLQNLELPLRVSDHWLLKLLFWVGTFLCVGGALVFATILGAGQVLGTLFFCGFAAFCGYCVLMIGIIEADTESVTLKVPLGFYRMRWDEVTVVETDVYGSLVLCGENKHLGITSPSFWSGGDKEMMVHFLFTQIELRGIPLKPVRVSLKFTRNTKVK